MLGSIFTIHPNRFFEIYLDFFKKRNPANVKNKIANIAFLLFSSFPSPRSLIRIFFLFLILVRFSSKKIPFDLLFQSNGLNVVVGAF